MGWLIATTQKNAALHAVQCVNLLVALIWKMMNSVRGWILTDSAKVRPVCAIGVNVGTKMTRSVVNGIWGDAKWNLNGLIRFVRFAEAAIL